MGGLQFLSMGWLYAAPAFIGALVLLYFLKLKRREVAISSTYLWQTALDDMRVNSPLQRLRMNLLLILQLLALILILLALARPVSSLTGAKGTDAILLIDVSASMNATDGDSTGATRFQRAVEEANRVVDGMGLGDRAIVIAFSDEARVLTDMTESQATLRKALKDLKPTDRPTKLAGALHRVRALINKDDRTPQLFVFSDGRVGSLAGVSLEKEIPLNYVKIGSKADNVGIVGLDVHMASGLGDETRVFVSVKNHGARSETFGIDFHIDDQMLRSRELTLGPGGQASVPFDAPLLQEGQDQKVRRVKVSLDHADALPTDNVAHALLRPREPIRVLLVTDMEIGGNVFLQRALSEDPRVAKTKAGTVPILSPAKLDPEDPDLLGYQVIVLDRATPKALPPGNYLCFGARPPFPGFKDLGQVENSKVLDWDETHPVARFVNFGSLIMPTSRRFKVRKKDKVIVRATYGPLLIDARDGDRRALVCAFDLMALPVEGAWTFDPSFPIFLANVVRILGGDEGKGSKSQLVTTGEVAELRFPPTTTHVKVDPPHGEPYESKILEGDEVLHVTGIDRTGLYAATFRDANQTALQTRQFAANLVDSEESQVAPAENLVVEDRAVKGEEEARDSNRELWRWLVAAALTLVMLEWWIYNRRVFI